MKILQPFLNVKNNLKTTPSSLIYLNKVQFSVPLKCLYVSVEMCCEPLFGDAHIYKWEKLFKLWTEKKKKNQWWIPPERPLENMGNEFFKPPRTGDFVFICHLPSVVSKYSEEWTHAWERAIETHYKAEYKIVKILKCTQCNWDYL